MQASDYKIRRGEIATYFDETAVDAWKKLTSDAPVSRIRATVREGRRETLNTLLSWLPQDLHGRRILDAGCGTGLLAVEMARRGADVVAIDLSPKLVQLAEKRFLDSGETLKGSLSFTSGDMLDPALGQFDHGVAMDSLIHYESTDMLAALGGLVQRIDESLLFTFAPKTAMLTLMHKAGQWFPRSDRSPAIVPIAVKRLHASVADDVLLNHWSTGRDHRIDTSFYKSHAQELVKA